MISVPQYCANCKYWACYDEEKFEKHYGLAEGECHRYPPNSPNLFSGNKVGKEDEYIKELVLSLIKGTPLMSHVFTFAEDWCGEFVPAEVIRYYEDEDEDDCEEVDDWGDEK